MMAAMAQTGCDDGGQERPAGSRSRAGNPNRSYRVKLERRAARIALAMTEAEKGAEILTAAAQYLHDAAGAYHGRPEPEGDNLVFAKLPEDGPALAAHLAVMPMVQLLHVFVPAIAEAYSEGRLSIVQLVALLSVVRARIRIALDIPDLADSKALRDATSWQLRRSEAGRIIAPRTGVLLDRLLKRIPAVGDACRLAEVCTREDPGYTALRRGMKCDSRFRVERMVLAGHRGAALVVTRISEESQS